MVPLRTLRGLLSSLENAEASSSPLELPTGDALRPWWFMLHGGESRCLLSSLLPELQPGKFQALGDGILFMGCTMSPSKNIWDWLLGSLLTIIGIAIGIPEAEEISEEGVEALEEELELPAWVEEDEDEVPEENPDWNML